MKGREERAEDTIRILLCDDHLVVRKGLRNILAGEPDFEVVGEAGDGAEAILLSERLRPDVILMDLSMPRMDGIEATAGIKARSPEARILVLTHNETDSHLLRALEAGAIGYTLKSAPAEELFASVREVSLGHSPLTASMAARLLPHLRDTASGALKPREVEVIRLLAEGKKDKEIANELHLGLTTVKDHLSNAYDKLGAVNGPSAVAAAFRQGII